MTALLRHDFGGPPEKNHGILIPPGDGVSADGLIAFTQRHDARMRALHTYLTPVRASSASCSSTTRRSRPTRRRSRACPRFACEHLQGCLCLVGELTLQVAHQYEPPARSAGRDRDVDPIVGPFQGSRACHGSLTGRGHLLPSCSTRRAAPRAARSRRLEPRAHRSGDGQRARAAKVGGLREEAAGSVVQAGAPRGRRDGCCRRVKVSAHASAVRRRRLASPAPRTSRRRGR